MTHPFVGIGHRAEKQFYPSPVAQTIESKAPANSNENDDARDGQFEYWARCAIHDLLSIKDLEQGRELIAMYITDWIEGRRHHG